MNLQEKLRPIAHSIVTEAARVERGSRVLIWYDELALPLVQEVEVVCKKAGILTTHFMRDLEIQVEQISKLRAEKIISIFNEEKQKLDNCDCVIILRAPENPEIIGTLPSDKYRAYFEAYEKVHSKRFSNDLNWTLFYYPTKHEARQEQMDYNEYLDLVIRSCHQPWDKIYEAQQLLIETYLNPGKDLVLIANPDDLDHNRRTRVEMSIANMTFVNSTVDNNFPGSEVFSAPVKTSINGHIFAEGTYVYGGKKMNNISFDIASGKITKAAAQEGDKGLQEILSQGKGARYFGEVALGTNPGLNKRLFNALLNEKVSGSFHMAIGHCYTFDTDRGKKVNVNNGNLPKSTSVHWDVTIMMGKEYGGGEVIVDGKTIQKDGMFLDSRLKVLNRNS